MPLSRVPHPARSERKKGRPENLTARTSHRGKSPAGRFFRQFAEPERFCRFQHTRELQCAGATHEGLGGFSISARAARGRAVGERFHVRKSPCHFLIWESRSGRFLPIVLAAENLRPDTKQ